MPDSGSVTVWVKVINDNGCVDSTSTTIIVYKLPTAPALADAATYCATSAAIPFMSVSGYSYQLQNVSTQSLSSPLAGTGAPLSFQITTDGTYTIVATDNATNCTAVSNEQTVSFYEALAAGSITTAGYISCNNVAGTATVEATAPSGGDGNYSYQWTVKYNSGGTTVIADATEATYTPPATATAGTYVYNRQVKDGCTPAFTPSAGTVTREVRTALDAGSIISLLRRRRCTKDEQKEVSGCHGLESPERIVLGHGYQCNGAARSPRTIRSNVANDVQ
jgi:hypothetical protein